MVVKILRAHVNDAIKLEQEINEFTNGLFEKALERNKRAGNVITEELVSRLKTHISKQVKIDTMVVQQWDMEFVSSDGDINHSHEEPVLIAVIKY